MRRMSAYNISDQVRDSIGRYVDQRIPTGGFLGAVLENDLLQGAFGSADDRNRRDLFDIVRYCRWEIPGDCWGSPEKVTAWLNQETT